jgi:nitroreductase
MDLQEVIEKRKSVRSFQKTDVPDKLLEEIIALARKSPSAGALRAYKTIITREKITSIDAPVYLVICANPEAYAPRYGERGKNLYSIQDATIFGAYIQLLLVDKGLASVWIGAFREDKIKKILNIEENLRPIAIIALGIESGITN